MRLERSSLSTARAAAKVGLMGLTAVILVSLWLGTAYESPTPINHRAYPPPQPDFSRATPLPSTAAEKLHSTDAAARQLGAEQLVAIIETRWPDDHRRAFLSEIAPTALQSAVEHCVPPSVTLAQAIQESGLSVHPRPTQVA